MKTRLMNVDDVGLPVKRGLHPILSVTFQGVTVSFSVQTLKFTMINAVLLGNALVGSCIST